VLTLESLDPRVLPSIAFDVNVSRTPAGVVAEGAYTGGGPRVQVSVRDVVVFDRFVFEEGFRGGVDVALADLDDDRDLDLVVSAGVGGGPRVRTWLNDGAYNLTPDTDVFLDVPWNGVNLDAYARPHAGFAQTEKFAGLPSLIPLNRPNRDVEAYLGYLSDDLQRLLAGRGLKIHTFDGNLVGDVLPQVTARTGAAMTNRTVYLGTDYAFAVLHEIGHFVQNYVFTAGQWVESVRIALARPDPVDFQEFWAEEFVAYAKTGRDAYGLFARALTNR